MKQPLVSVLAPVFNGSAFVRETLQSVLRQTYRRIEVIVVDDGSTDDTADIVERTAVRDRRVRLIRQQNRGVAAARNRALQASQGEFVAPIDADDLWHATKLETQLQCLQGGPGHPGFVYCWWVWIDDKGDVLDSSPRWRVEGDIFEKLVEINFTGNASVPLFRRECVEEVGGYNDQLMEAGAQGCEDWELAIRVAERHTARMVPAFLVGYRRLRNSMSAACGAMWRSHELIMDNLRQRRPAISRDLLRRSRSQFAMHLAGISFWSGSYLDAIRWLYRARQPGLVLAVSPDLLRNSVRLLARRESVRAKLHYNTEGLEQGMIPDSIIHYERIFNRRWQTGRTANPL